VPARRADAPNDFIWFEQEAVLERFPNRDCTFSVEVSAYCGDVGVKARLADYIATFPLTAIGGYVKRTGSTTRAVVECNFDVMRQIFGWFRHNYRNYTITHIQCAQPVPPKFRGVFRICRSVPDCRENSSGDVPEEDGVSASSRSDPRTARSVSANT
jgi:hypothetical protein